MRFLAAICAGGFLFSSGAPEVIRTAQAEQAEAPAHRVTFSGVQSFPDGSSRLFVRLTSKPTLRKASRPRRVVFTLADTHVGVRNNKNPLDLRHFRSPLVRAQLVPAGSDLELRLKLRKEVKMQHRFARRNDGSYSLQIDLPPL